MVLLEYIIKVGHEQVVVAGNLFCFFDVYFDSFSLNFFFWNEARQNVFAIQTLKDFQCIDKDGKDQGLEVTYIREWAILKGANAVSLNREVRLVGSSKQAEQQLFYNSPLSKFSSYKYRFDYDIHQDMSVETGNNNFFK